MDILKKSGTREWSDVSHNIGVGCSHLCIYCYAAAHATKNGIVSDREEWGTERATPRRVPTKDGVIMFPTAHDISPFYLEESLKTIDEMMQAGRQIVIVTKAHLECVKSICAVIKKHENYYDKVLLRVTIGSMNEELCKAWEPGAPSPQERLEALKYAFLNYIRTSVSVEPMLGGPVDASEVFESVDPYVSEDIWFGKMNDLNTRLEDGEGKAELIRLVNEEQCDENIMLLYNTYKNDKKVKWKDSIKAIIDRNNK